MDVDELLSQAWSAVKGAGIPEPLHAMALKEAIDYLRAKEDADSAESPHGAPGAGSSGQATGGGGVRRETPRSSGTNATSRAASFFSRLATESGVSEAELRDILTLTPDSVVHVTQPTKDLGSNVTEQARNVTALVAAARAIGLGEEPVDAGAVRQELERKRCYDSSNFASGHLGKLKGFNAGANRNQIVLTSKWVGEFSTAVAKAHGRGDDGESQ